MTGHRFPRARQVVEVAGSFVVQDATGQKVAWFHFHDGATGVPLLKERAKRRAINFAGKLLDKADHNLLRDDITTIDHALTQPWTVNKTYRRDPKVKEPVWITEACGGDNSMVRIGEDAYFMSTDGYLMPIKKNQPPPDLRYFKQPQK